MSESHISRIRIIVLACAFNILLLQTANAQPYAQQQVNYSIQVTLNDVSNELTAFQTIEYINNQPDTLHYIYFHLWPNAYSNNKTPLAKELFKLNGKSKLFNDSELAGYMDSLDFKIDNTMAHWELMTHSPDICCLWLNKPLYPTDTIIITTPFRVKIPKGVTSRMGHYKQSYQISQWYPKPAVYNKSGWHAMPYLDQGEYFSEFGSFDVSITIADNYVVGASGNLQNTDELQWLNLLAADSLWKDIKPVYALKQIPSSTKTKTLRYVISNAHDFAWFADKGFNVRKSKVVLPNSNKEVTTWAMFTNKHAALWKHAITYSDSAIWYFSKLIGDYPYDSYTVVQSTLNAGLGMEYPGISVIGYVTNAYALEEVVAHEIAHNWFYAAIGSNERDFPFLDESITSAYTTRFMNHMHPNKKRLQTYILNKKIAKAFEIDNISVEQHQEIEWLIQARENREQPIDMHSANFTWHNYYLMLYYKAAIGFDYLRAYLGDSLFDATIKDYYKKWKFKHPQPEDLRHAFENNSDKDLSWFFDDFISTTKTIDYAIVELKSNKVLIKNRGKIASPLIVAGIRNDSVIFEKWVDGFLGYKWMDIPPGDYARIKIDPNHLMPELYRTNNSIRTAGLLRKTPPLKLRFLYAFDNPEINTLVYLPAANWNRESGFMAGVIIHNRLALPKPFEFSFMPFYSFKRSNFLGYSNASYNIIPYSNLIRKITLNIAATRFDAPGNKNYHTLKTGTELYFKPTVKNSNYQHMVYTYYHAAPELAQVISQQAAKINSFLQAGYEVEKTGHLNPLKLSVLLEAGKKHQKASTELKYKHSYFGKNNGLDIRLFSGIIIKNNTVNNYYNFSAGGRNGRELYLFEGTFPDRFSNVSSSFWSTQMVVLEGALVSPVNHVYGYSNWIVSLSLASSLPNKTSFLPIKPFVNLVLNEAQTNKNLNLFFEAGLKAGFWDFFEVHIPILVSDNLHSVNTSVKERIRFILNLNTLTNIRL